VPTVRRQPVDQVVIGCGGTGSGFGRPRWFGIVIRSMWIALRLSSARLSGSAPSFSGIACPMDAQARRRGGKPRC
jgi:hypothetical protein